MVAIIQESSVIADLIPEVHYYVDQDTPLPGDLVSSVSRVLGQLILTAFFGSDEDHDECDPEWIQRLRQDPALIELSVVAWREVHVLDLEGTFIIYTQDPQNVAEPVRQTAPYLRHGRARHPRSQPYQRFVGFRP